VLADAWHSSSLCSQPYDISTETSSYSKATGSTITTVTHPSSSKTVCKRTLAAAVEEKQRWAAVSMHTTAFNNTYCSSVVAYMTLHSTPFSTSSNHSIKIVRQQQVAIMASHLYEGLAAAASRPDSKNSAAAAVARLPSC
jgi:hypothetical protein